MKTINIIKLALLAGLVMPIHSFGQSNFYYTFDNEKIHLTPLIAKFAVEFPDGVIESSFLQNNVGYNKINSNVYLVTDTTSIHNIAATYFITPVYTTNDGLEMYLTSRIVLKFNNNVNQNAKSNIINSNNLQYIKTTSVYEMYSCTNALNTAKLIYESGLVKFCHPDFISPNVQPFYTPNDAYFGMQFYLHNTGQQINDGHSGTNDADIDAPEAWDITKGDPNVVVAVIDEGVTSDHPDLPNTRQVRLNGSNFGGGSPDDPSPVSSLTSGNNHGNACAGIIGATQDNNEGITGKLLPYAKLCL